MALYGALAEGFTATYGTRPGEFFSRGQLTVTGSGLVTVPLPVRTVTFTGATIVAAVAPGLDPALCTVGPPTNNTFTIYLWQFTSNANPTLIASVTATPVNWFAWGTL
jgi:hypothetical protein